ncbi:unnamed protein product [Ceutorhynchus assimilis]|uniref:Uncharacterized protein n=1 Tax=Ceutorhynchus assimilis TaxID=467358 RepID=A0A9N9QBC7_9CUCU|nr:unnamed protein product [Ceutorhynchus assimilis]
MANFAVSLKRSPSDFEEQMLYRKKADIRNDVDKAEPKDLTNRSNMFPSAQIKMRLMSPNISPATSPTMSTSSSPTPPPAANSTMSASYNKMTGIPCVAAASRYTAPVHIDVGGTIYTSSLETLTKKKQTLYIDINKSDKVRLSYLQCQFSDVTCRKPIAICVNDQSKHKLNMAAMVKHL